MQRSRPRRASPNPSIEGTFSSRLRLLPPAPHVKRWASRRGDVRHRSNLAEGQMSLLTLVEIARYWL
jgi:hypothetical protein